MSNTKRVEIQALCRQVTHAKLKIILLQNWVCAREYCRLGVAKKNCWHKAGRTTKSKISLYAVELRLYLTKTKELTPGKRKTESD